jgi:hypothetical protein
MNSPSQNDRLTLRRVWPAIVGVLVFGAMMGLRLEFDSGCARAAVVACAFMILALGIQASRNRHKD